MHHHWCIFQWIFRPFPNLPLHQPISTKTLFVVGIRTSKAHCFTTGKPPTTPIPFEFCTIQRSVLVIIIIRCCKSLTIMVSLCKCIRYNTQEEVICIWFVMNSCLFNFEALLLRSMNLRNQVLSRPINITFIDKHSRSDANKSNNILIDVLIIWMKHKMFCPLSF